MTKNILVTDANGDIIGTTFPKRAKGLIKSGRASFVDEGTIRMSAGKAPPEHKSIISEETKSMIYITFKGDEWVRRNTDISFMTGLDGKLSETLMLGSWDSAESVAVSRPYMLTPNTSYSYVFWLNSGENESANEVCNFKITFFNDWENCNVYRLNRGYIKPLLHQQGWELYEIPFTTPDVAGDVSVTFSFTAAKAPMAVMPAKEPAAYSDMKDEPDEYAAYRPQRHNIVFQDGWPSITQYGGDKYSTEAIRKKLAKGSFKEGFKNGVPFDADEFNEKFNKEFNEKFNKEFNEKFNKKFKKNFHFSFSSDDDDDRDELAEELEELHDEIEDMLDDIEDNLDDIAGDLEDADEDLHEIMEDDDFDASKFQSEIDSFTDELGAIGNEIGKYNSVLSGLRDAFDGIDTDSFKNFPEANREALKTLHSNVESVGNSVEGLEDRLSDLADDISGLN